MPAVAARGRPWGRSRTFTERGYGFITTADGEDVFFDREAVHRLAFEALTPGRVAGLGIEPGRPGRQAARVFPADEDSFADA